MRDYKKCIKKEVLCDKAYFTALYFWTDTAQLVLAKLDSN